MRLSFLRSLTPPLIQRAFPIQTHQQLSLYLHRRPSSSQPQPPVAPVPFVDNVATLFNASALSSKERPLQATIIHR